jgi:FtsP/CotA-like multicopper oxidase with cupredoxin domain
MFKLQNKLMMAHGMASNGACFIYPQGTQPTLVPNPDRTFKRQVYMGGSILMDDGVSVSIWGFNGENLDKAGNVIARSNGTQTGGGMMSGSFPSLPMRITQGDLAHTVLDVAAMNGNGMAWKHTVHHHGIEPEYRSDGVGHTSWDVSSNYTYQWSPQHAGTYFYHCHTNTVLHAEMGMYGALIVDPPRATGEPLRAFENGPSYTVEAIWAVDEIDPTWHESPQNWPAGTCGGDAGLNKLNPQYFIISGVDGATSASTDSSVAVTMKSTDTLLIRYVNAGYLPQRMRFPSGLTGTLIASDGRPLPKPIVIDSNSFLETVSAERYDIIIAAPTAGVYNIEFDIQDWITAKVLGMAKTVITVV